MGDHTTEHCWMLRQQVKLLIQRGHLKKFVEYSQGEGFKARCRKGNPGRKYDRGEDQKQTNTREETEQEKDNKGYVGSIAIGVLGEEPPPHHREGM